MQLTHTQRVYEDFERGNSGEYHDLYRQSNTLLLADVFENYQNIFLETYELDPGHFLTVTGLTQKVSLKKTKVKLDLVTDIDMLLIIEKRISGGVCHAYANHQYAKSNNK